MTAQAVARDHYRTRRQLTRAVDIQATRAWRDIDPAALDESWPAGRDQTLVTLAGAQLLAAGHADSYVDRALTEQDIDPASSGRVRPAALSGIASDGRDLASLLGQPLITTKIALRDGAALEQALAAGLATLRMIVGTQLADAGRGADQIALTARPAAGGYVRMTSGTSCPRCAILAGKWFGWNSGFQRHPRCDCIHIPSRENLAGDLRTNPRALIESGQVKGLSKADTRAILDHGADPAQVINAHRGMYTATGRKLTREGTTRRGLAGSRLGGRRRLMPETILRDAADRDDAVRLLRQHGYIL